MIAYHIVLKIIIEEHGKSAMLEDYTYLAPMMYMDFLIYTIILTECYIRRGFMIRNIHCR